LGIPEATVGYIIKKGLDKDLRNYRRKEAYALNGSKNLRKKKK